MQYSNILACKLQVIFYQLFVKVFVDYNENTAKTCATFNCASFGGVVIKI
jgi:hypothetical protein